MLKKILILTSEHAGHGHKSVANALESGFVNHADISTFAVNGFALAGSIGLAFERLYTPSVKYFPTGWHWFFNLTSNHARGTNKVAAFMIKRRLVKLIAETKPDLILSTNSVFVGSIINVLREKELSVPFYAVLTDIISLSKTWFDARTDLTFSPSDNATAVMLKSGICADKIITLGFPVRSGFYTHIRSSDELAVSQSGKVKFLIVNGSYKARSLIDIIDRLLSDYPCHVTFISGRDKQVRSRLERHYSRTKNITVLGFSDDMGSHLRKNDILLTRCGANILMEAINCLIPIVSLGTIPGQESQNPDFIESYGFGKKTNGIDDIFAKIDELLDSDRKLLRQIRQNQFNYAGRNATEKTIFHIIDSYERFCSEGK